MTAVRPAMNAAELPGKREHFKEGILAYRVLECTYIKALTAISIAPPNMWRGYAGLRNVVAGLPHEQSRLHEQSVAAEIKGGGND